MPGSKTHFGLGALTSAGYYIAECEHKNQNYNIAEILGVALGGGISGSLPDQIEPATNPHHRSLFHSATTGAALTKATTEVDNLDLTEKQQTALKSMSIGYLSHLGADATTPKGLPLLK